MAPAQAPAQPARGHGRGQQDAAEVLRVLKQAAYFVVFSVPDPQSLSQGVPLVPLLPASIYKIEITEAPRRLRLNVRPPSPDCGLLTSKEVSQRQVAQQHLVMAVCPNDFQGGPGRTPPPTVLVPFLSQRFIMTDGNFQFLDGRGSGFHAMASGRFFPAQVAGKTQLRIGGAVEILEGFGALEGVIGNLVINGETTPPSEFANSFIFRFVDPQGQLTAKGPLPPVVPMEPDPDPLTAFVPVMAELDPDHPPTVTAASDGRQKRIHMVQRLRLVDTNFQVAPGVLSSYLVEGEVIGRQETTLVFDPDDPQDVIPLYSARSQLTFFTARRETIGTLQADLYEGRAFRTVLPQLARPFFRIAGFGPFTAGTGQFVDAVGMVAANGALSLEPPALTAMYLLRISDPLGRFKRLAPSPLATAARAAVQT